MAIALAQELGLVQGIIEGIRITYLLYDVGKISLPIEILSKPSILNEIEFNLIKNHPRTGYDILKSIDFSYPIARITLQHHERINGSGYPNRLNDGKILLDTKIIGVADIVRIHVFSSSVSACFRNR
ncbi:MAG: HD domain-containing protein [Candidatus Atribacteria bacterium]|nr:HD domain-containing protein [Candidatus Atribacteria bacterium]